MWVVLGGFIGLDLLELIEEGAHGWATGCGFGLVLDVVLNYLVGISFETAVGRGRDSYGPSYGFDILGS